MNDMDLPKILIVDDRPQNILVLEKLLRRLPVKILSATSGNQALGMVLEHAFALILLDVQMPDMDGFETAELMRGSDDAGQVPIIFVTAISKEEKYVFQGYESGAVDYLFKPFDPDILKSKINVFLELYRQKARLIKINRELKRANRKILDQQRAVIEEERLKVLLQMAGATAHELNQPLMALLGNIELMELSATIPPESAKQISRIKEAGERIANTVKKIQTIRHSEIKPYCQNTYIIDLGKALSILSIESSGTDFEMLKNYLPENDRIKMEQAATLKTAFGYLKNKAYDLIFSDYLFDDGTVFDLFAGMEKNGLEIPVVVITGQGDEVLASQMIQIGAYDYLPKNRLTAEVLKAAIAQTQEKARLKMEMRQAQAKMAEMSTRDALTRLANRRYFNEVLDVQFQRCRRFDGDLALGIIDLDHFKRINDRYGHPAGDQVLVSLGEALKACMRQNDLACRYGGEEFAFILPRTDTQQAKAVCERLRETIGALCVTHEDHQISVTASIGLAMAEGVESPQTLLANADKALYEAKHRGRNRLVVC